MRVFIIKLFNFVLVFFVIYILIGFFLFRNNRSVTNELINYQREKIDRISS